MRRSSLVVVSVWALVMSASLWTAIAHPFTQQAVGTEVANLTQVTGTVQFRPHDIALWDYAALGQNLYAEDVVATGERSKAVLDLGDGQAIRLDENTQLALDFAKAGGETVVTLLKGRVNLVAGDNPSVARHHAPVALVAGGHRLTLAGAGSSLNVNRDVRKSTVSVAVERGEVLATKADVAEGQSNEVESLKPAAPPTEWQTVPETPKSVETPKIRAVAYTLPVTAPEAVVPALPAAFAEEPKPLPSPRITEPEARPPPVLESLVEVKDPYAIFVGHSGRPVAPFLVASLQPADVVSVVRAQDRSDGAIAWDASVRQGVPLLPGDLTAGMKFSELIVGASFGPVGGPVAIYQTMITGDGVLDDIPSSIATKQASLGWNFDWRPRAALAVGGGPRLGEATVDATLPVGVDGGASVMGRVRAKKLRTLGAGLSASLALPWGTPKVSADFNKVTTQKSGPSGSTTEGELQYALPAWEAGSVRVSALAFARYMRRTYHQKSDGETDVTRLEDFDFKQAFAGIGLTFDW